MIQMLRATLYALLIVFIYFVIFFILIKLMKKDNCCDCSIIDKNVCTECRIFYKIKGDDLSKCIRTTLFYVIIGVGGGVPVLIIILIFFSFCYKTCKMNRIAKLIQH